ncbi:MAG TPA: cytochrome c oxidase subunit 3 [Puia sp.]|nr:cytochrome c oxidase subunit 3 [Puia sp.]
MIEPIEATNIVSDQQKRIHPHKFTLWVAIGSIIMMFAGLTSAYIVKREQPGWSTFDIPKAFWFSTSSILLSSLTIQMALKAFRDRQMKQYRNLVTVTAALGILFVILQWIGFRQIWNTGITFHGSGAGQFLYIIAGLHALHVTGGVIALIVMFVKAFRTRIRSYNVVPVEVVSTYWHFVDILWIYLFFFFLWIH